MMSRCYLWGMANNNGTYEVGDVVESLVDAQGLEMRRHYRVQEVTTKSNFLGRFTSYNLCTLDTEKTINNVGNGHLVLKLVRSAS